MFDKENPGNGPENVDNSGQKEQDPDQSAKKTVAEASDVKPIDGINDVPLPEPMSRPSIDVPDIGSINISENEKFQDFNTHLLALAKRNMDRNYYKNRDAMTVEDVTFVLTKRTGNYPALVKIYVDDPRSSAVIEQVIHLEDEVKTAEGHFDHYVWREGVVRKQDIPLLEQALGIKTYVEKEEE